MRHTTFSSICRGSAPAAALVALLAGCGPDSTATPPNGAAVPATTVASPTVAAAPIGTDGASLTNGALSAPSPTSPGHGNTPAAMPEAAATDPSLIGQSATGGAIGAIYELRSIRAGLQADGTIRVVWEMAQPSGGPLFEAVLKSNLAEPPAAAVGGDARIEVTLHDVTGFDLQDILPVAVPSGGPLVEVRLLPVMDDSVLMFGVGLTEPARFEARLLEAPVRLVLDILPPRQ